MAAIPQWPLVLNCIIILLECHHRVPWILFTEYILWCVVCMQMHNCTQIPCHNKFNTLWTPAEVAWEDTWTLPKAQPPYSETLMEAIWSPRSSRAAPELLLLASDDVQELFTLPFWTTASDGCNSYPPECGVIWDGTTWPFEVNGTRLMLMGRKCRTPQQ